MGCLFFFFRYTLKDNSKKHIEVWDPSPEEIISNEVNNLINPLFAKSLPSEDLQSLYNKELPVHICNIVSPEKIYVQWLLTENLLHRYNIQGKHIVHIVYSLFCILFQRSRTHKCRILKVQNYFR